VWGEVYFLFVDKCRKTFAQKYDKDVFMMKNDTIFFHQIHMYTNISTRSLDREGKIYWKVRIEKLSTYQQP